MARTKAVLTPDLRLTDFISLGVIAKTIPLTTINLVLEENGKASHRQRDFPALSGSSTRAGQQMLNLRTYTG